MLTSMGIVVGVSLIGWWVTAPPRAEGASRPRTAREARRQVARGSRWGVWWRDLEPIGRLVGSRVPASLGPRLARAGTPAGLTPTEWAHILMGATILAGCGAALLLLLVLGGVLPFTALLGAWLLGMLPALPGLVLDAWGNVRIATLEARLPDLTARISVGLRAGLPVRRAFADALETECHSGRTPAWLQRDLSRVASRLDLSSMNLIDALALLHTSIPSDDLTVLIGQLTVAHQSGAPLADTLRAYARGRRETFSTERQSRVGSAIMTINLVGALPGATLAGILVYYALTLVTSGVSHAWHG